MTTLYLASYKATRPGMAGLANRAIRFFTKSIYSHSELCAGDPFAGPVDCLSAVGSEGGVRMKRMQLSPDKWDVIPLPDTPVDAMYSFWAEHKGEPYDWVGCVRTVLPFVGREHPLAWFCSEICATVRAYPQAWRMHPGVLHMVESK